MRNQVNTLVDMNNAYEMIGFNPYESESYTDASVAFSSGLSMLPAIVSNHGIYTANNLASDIGFFSAYQGVQPQVELLKCYSQEIIQEYFESYVCCLVDYILYEDAQSKRDNYKYLVEKYGKSVDEIKSILSGAAVIKSENLTENKYHIYDDNSDFVVKTKEFLID